QVFERVGLQPPPHPTQANRPRPAHSAPASVPPVQPAAAAPNGAGGMLGRVTRAAGTILLVTLALLIGARGLRRRRHRRAGAPGAWSEVLDLLLLADRRPAAWHTAVRIAHDVAAAFPVPQPHPITRLARCADRAAFGPRGSTVDDP